MTEEINISFKNLQYSVKVDFFGKKKQILKSINGEFRGNELSAILGPSGCGKSTLLNILSGFITTNIQGEIFVNNHIRDFNSFRKISSYIMQNENLFSSLTLRETMMFSIKLKTGYLLTAEQQMKKVALILSNLGLAEHTDTIVGKLSGGQQRRLSIAVELVDDPQVLFLDEATTGLDSNATSQCIQLLKQLAVEGKTVICTIHQPSARLLKQFDHIYALAGGKCVYQGSQKNLIPFLQELNLICPQTYNPADFLLEIAHNDYGPQNERLTEKIENGLNIQFRQRQNADYDLSNSSSCIFTNFNHSSFLYQVALLIQRNSLLSKRDKGLILTRVTTYVCVGLLVGILYYQIGNEAKQMINIFKSIYAMATYLMYASLYSLFIKFPLDANIIRREHFNGHYRSIAYYTALILADVPTLLICSSIFTFIAYMLIDHPLESFRFFNLLAIGIFMSFTSQAYGIFSGVLTTHLNMGVMLTALFMVTQIIFGGGLVLAQDVSPLWQYVFNACFMKQAFDGFSLLIFGYDRTKLNCNEMYCHFRSPTKFFELIGVETSLTKVFSSLGIMFVIYHVISYCIIRYRLRN